jgi:hypothetical protein
VGDVAARAAVAAQRLAVFRRLAHPSPEVGQSGPVRVLVMPVRALLQPVVEGLGDLEPVELSAGQSADHDVLSGADREELWEIAARVILPLANHSDDPYLNDSNYLEWRLTNRDAFFPLPDLDYVDHWCTLAAPGLLDLAREQISRLQVGV